MNKEKTFSQSAERFCQLLDKEIQKKVRPAGV